LYKFNFLILSLLVGGWSFGLVSGFRPTYPKEIFFLWATLSAAGLLINLKIGGNKITKILILMLLAIPGLIPIYEEPMVLFYFVSILVTFLLLLNDKDLTMKLNPLIILLFFITLIAIGFIYTSTGAFYIFGIQPSITDLLFISIFLLIWTDASGSSPVYSKQIFFLTIAICFMYGFFMNSRVIVMTPFLMIVLTYLNTRLPNAFNSSFYMGVVLICIFGFGGKYFIPDMIFDLKGEINELGDVAGIEAKRFSLLLNGWEVLHNSSYMGVGFGPGVYLDFTEDNPLGISPQFLPLSLAAYSGVLFSSYFVYTFARWVTRPVSSTNKAARVIIFCFLLVHEYVFNPIFWVVLIISSNQGKVKQ
tara:strand:+ start:6077 stop:7162 length:1086 start_codon:yes stop_codon:yes gene_type:complete